MKKIFSLLALFLLFFSGAMAQDVTYSRGELLTAEQVKEGGMKVYLRIYTTTADFCINYAGRALNGNYFEDDPSIVFDVIKADGGVKLRTSEGKYFGHNSDNTLLVTDDADAACVFDPYQVESGVANVADGMDSGNAMRWRPLGTEVWLNSNQILNGNPLFYNGGTGNWTCFFVYKANVSGETSTETLKTFTMNCARGYVYGTGSVLQGTTDASGASEFALVPYGENTYLYDVTNKMFAIGSVDDQSNLPNSGENTVTRESATDFSRIITDVTVGETGITNYPYYLADKYGNYLNMDGARRIYFNTRTDFEGGAGGNTYAITEVADFDPTEAIALLDAYFNPGATYDIVIVDAETEAEYTVATGIPATVGEVISELPDTYKKGYCTYDVEPLTVAAGADNKLVALAEYTLPFTEGKWYNVAIRGGYYLNTTHTGSQAGAYYPTSTVDTEDDSYIWGFKGNPLTGVVVVNYAHDGQSLAEEGNIAIMKDGDFAWDIFPNGEGFVLRVPGTANKYVNQNGGTAGYLGYWDSAWGREDAGSTLTLTEVEVPEAPVAETGSFEYLPSAGTLTSSTSGSSFCWLYTSTQTDPSFLLRTNNNAGATAQNIGPNNMQASETAINLFPGGSGCYYYLDAQDGYAITGWHITATATEAKTVTFNGEEYTFEDGVEKTLDFTLDEKASTVSFRLTGSNKALASNITVDWVKLNSSDVTYVINDEGGNELYRQTITTEVGTEVSELPVVLQRGFTEYEFTPFTVGNEDATVTTSVKFNLPFVTSSVESPKWYFIRQNDGTYLTAYNTYAYYTSKSDEDAGQHWAFFGNPYTGIQVYNEGTSNYVAGNGGSYGSLQDSPVAWDVNANGEGFTLYKDATQTWTTYNSYLYIWNWAGNQTIDVGRFFVEEVPVVEPAETFTEGYFNLVSEDTQKVLGLDAFNMNTVDVPAFVPTWTAIESNGDGTFKVSLPVQTSSGQHYMHIGSNARWSNGDASAITFYQVEDPAAETTVAKKAESLTLGATYLMVATYSGATYALTNSVYNAGSGNNQRMESAAVTVADDAITLERNAAVLWTAGAFEETENVEGLTDAPVLFRNNADNQFLSAADPQPETQSFEAIAAVVEEGVMGKISSTVTSEEGTFYVQLVGSSRYAYCGSNGRFSANSAANPLQLFKVADPTAETFEASKVNAFEAGEAKYLVVGTKSGVTYALTSNIYSEGTDNQRMEGTAVTITDDAISVAADKALLWSFVKVEAEDAPSYDAVFEPEVKTPEPEPGIQGTFRPTTRDAELVAGKEYMIYNAAVASGNKCWGFMHATDEGLYITGNAAPTEFTTDNKNYLFTLVDNGDGSYAVKNVGTGEVVVASVNITKWEESSDIRGGGASLRQDDGNVLPNGDFVGENVFVVTDNNPDDSSKARWNGNFWQQGDQDFDNVEVALLMFGKGHPYAFYVPEEVVEEKTVEVTYVVYDELEREVARFTADVAEGTVVETLPEEFVQEFCSYNVVEPVTVSEEDNEVLFEVSYELPFIEGQQYYLNVNGKYVHYDASKSKNYVAAKTVEEIEAAEDKAMYQWTISGNPFDGYTLFNVGAQQYLALAGNGETVLGENAATLSLATLGEGYTFTCEMGTVEDFYDTFAAISNESSIKDEWATIKFEEVPENLASYEKAINLSTGEFTISNPTKTWAAKWESTDGTPAIALTTNGNQMTANSDATVLPNEGLKIFTAAGGNQLYTIDVEDGYAITGYTIRGNAYTSDITATDVTTGDNLTFTNAAEVQTFTVTLPEPAASAGFRIGNTASVFLNAVITVNVQQLPTEDVTFSIYDEEENHVYTEVMPVLRGETVTELPEALKRDFCTYTYPAALEVTKGGHNVFLTTVKVEMPFVADGTTAYNLFASGNAYVYVADGAAAAKETLSEEDKADAAYAWTFTGNPYVGITVQNVGTGLYLADTEIPSGSWSTAISLSDEAEYATIETNGEGFQLRFGIQDFISVRDGVASVYGYLAASGTQSTRLAVEEANVQAPEPVEVDVTVNVVDGEGNVLETLTTTALTGTTLDEVPEDVTRLPLCDYAVNTPLLVKNGENVLTVNVTFQDAPFVTKDGEDAKWFNISTNDVLLVAGNNSVVGAPNTDANKVQDNAQWAVYGNPYAFKFFNKAQQKYVTGEEPAADGYTPAQFGDEAKSVILVEEEDGDYEFYDLFYDSDTEALYYLGAGYAGIIHTMMTFTAVPEGPVAEEEYEICFDKDQKPSRTDRWISNVQLGDQEINVAGSASEFMPYTNFFDAAGFSVEPGATVKPAIGYMAEWMHMYAYVDYDRDGQFKVEESEIAEGVIPEGQEIVSFSYFNGYNSASDAVSEGNKTFDMPEFQIPESLEPGYYAMRYKVDWNNVDPAGNPGPNNYILNNGGSITDVRLNVHPEMVTLTAEAAENGTVTYEGETLSGEGVQIPFGLEAGIKFVPAEGYKLDLVTVRHGYFNGNEYVHGVRQYDETVVDMNEVVRNNYFIPAELIDGNIVIIAKFTVNDGIRDILNGADVESAYSIDGRRLNDRNILNKGVYVINGKKVLVK
ncbi:MAG: hypothetical protein IJ684_01250 [Bacteroidales bacterium]|nr:hypothetical protein [Bacteroidales bacterium]